MSALSTFAILLGLPDHQAEDALHSERAARAVLSRRSFFAASGALATGAVFVPSAELVAPPPLASWNTGILMGGMAAIGLYLMATKR